MAPALDEQLTAEIKKIRAEMDAQKHIIKRSVGNALILGAAEQHLKELHTRLAVLETNRKKISTAATPV
jgi:chaperonin cofactor prefoldin